MFIILQITDVYKDTSQGFTTSTVTVEGLRKYSGESISIVIKNENLLAQRLNADGTKGDVLAVTPDLITIIDSDSGNLLLASIIMINCNNYIPYYCRLPHNN